MPLRKRQKIQAVLRKKIKTSEAWTTGRADAKQKLWVKAVGRAERNYNKKEGELVVELDQFKYTLNSYAQPFTELRDSL